MTEGPTDDFLRLLEHAHRRQVLKALLDHPETGLRLDECVEWDTDTPGTSTEFERHLDMLQRAEVVEYDESSDVVFRGPRFDDIEPLVRSISESTDPSDFEEERDLLALIIRALRHDLLNGLTVVQSRAEILETDAVGDAEHDHQRVIDDRIRKMVSRIETMDALTESVVNDGAHNLEAYHLHEVLDDEIEKLREVHPGAEIVRRDVPDVSVRADERLSLLFENILRNALEHHDSKEPTVRATGKCRDGIVEISIVDDGPGIPETQTTDLFEDGLSKSERNGGGFGLYFVKRTVDEYGGEVTIENREPSGTVVTIRLERLETDEGVSATAPAANAPEGEN